MAAETNNKFTPMVDEPLQDKDAIVGPPRPTGEDFLAALNIGDAPSAVIILRLLKGLSRAECAELAEVLDHDPAIPLTPFILKFAHRSAGKPPKTWDKLERRYAIYLRFNKLRLKKKNKNKSKKKVGDDPEQSVIKTLAKEFGVSVSTVYSEIKKAKAKMMKWPNSN